MSKWLQSWPVFAIVFYLDATKKVLERRIYRAASCRTREFVFTEMERVIKFGAYIFVEIDTSRQIKAAQGLLFSQDIIDCCIRCITGEVVNTQRGIATEEFILLVLVLRQRSSREDQDQSCKRRQLFHDLSFCSLLPGRVLLYWHYKKSRTVNCDRIKVAVQFRNGEGVG